MFTYLIIGVIYSFILTLFLDYQIKKEGEGRRRNFNAFETIILIILWPIYLGIFIRSFFKNLNNE